MSLYDERSGQWIDNSKPAPIGGVSSGSAGSYAYPFKTKKPGDAIPGAEDMVAPENDPSGYADSLRLFGMPTSSFSRNYNELAMNLGLDPFGVDPRRKKKKRFLGDASLGDWANLFKGATDHYGIYQGTKLGEKQLAHADNIYNLKKDQMTRQNKVSDYLIKSQIADKNMQRGILGDYLVRTTAAHQGKDPQDVIPLLPEYNVG